MDKGENTVAATSIKSHGNSAEIQIGDKGTVAVKMLGREVEMSKKEFLQLCAEWQKHNGRIPGR